MYRTAPKPELEKRPSSTEKKVKLYCKLFGHDTTDDQLTTCIHKGLKLCKRCGNEVWAKKDDPFIAKEREYLNDLPPGKYVSPHFTCSSKHCRAQEREDIYNGTTIEDEHGNVVNFRK